MWTLRRQPACQRGSERRECSGGHDGGRISGGGGRMSPPLRVYLYPALPLKSWNGLFRPIITKTVSNMMRRSKKNDRRRIYSRS